MKARLKYLVPALFNYQINIFSEWIIKLCKQKFGSKCILQKMAFPSFFTLVKCVEWLRYQALWPDKT